MPGFAGYALPLRALDRVVELAYQRIVTVKAVAGNESFFPGHYPEQPIYPGVFILEAVHQAVARYVSTSGCHAVPRLRRVRSIRFLHPVVPGDRLEVTCCCTPAADGGDLLVQANCSLDGGTAVAVVKLAYQLEKSNGAP